MSESPALTPRTILTLEVPVSKLEELADRLQEMFEQTVIQLERPKHERGWLEIYCAQTGEAELLAAAVQGWPEIFATSTRRESVRDWQTFWRHHFHVTDIGERLRIIPVWEDAAADGRAVIHLDPGLSFGTGDHFTTRFCLEMIDRLVPRHQLDSMLDVGTGSAILAIAARLLGASRVIGTDFDAIAIEQARENAKLNDMEDQIELVVGEAREGLPKGSFDLVCANVYTTVLLEIAPALVEATGKFLALSGIRDPELDQVANAYAALGLEEIFRDGNGEWGGLAFKKMNTMKTS